MAEPSPFGYCKTSPEIIRLAVTLYVHFPLSHRHVEDLLHERDIEVGPETNRYWWNRIGSIFASRTWRRCLAQAIMRASAGRPVSVHFSHVG